MNLSLLLIKKIQNNTVLAYAVDTLKFVLFILVIVLVFSWSLRNLPFLAKYDFFVIQTGSMEPVINAGDLVVIDNSVDRDSIKQGDIIAFNVDINGDGTEEVVVHYFSSREVRFGIEYFKSIPAISSDQDPWTLNMDHIIGVYKFKFRFIGKLVGFGQSTIGRIVILIDIILISIIADILKVKKVD